MFVNRSLLLVAALFAGTANLAAQGRITTSQLAPDVTLLQPNEGSGNTLILTGPDGQLIIDTMADTIAVQFAAAVAGTGASNVRYVFNTHWHQNHAGGNDRFPHATIIAPTRLRERLAVPQRLVFLGDYRYNALPEPYLPDVTFEDSVSVFFNGQEIRAWHVQGHTDSDAIIHLTGSNIVATGDLWSARGHIPGDMDTGGDMIGVQQALLNLSRHLPEDAIIVPGHGPTGTVAQLRTYVERLTAIIDHVRSARAQGRTLEEIRALPLPEAGRALVGNNSARMVEAVYRSLP